MEIKAIPAFETMYNTYSKMLYGIALEISPTEKEAEELLIATFKKAFDQKLSELNSTLICMSLIKLIVQTAHAQQNNSLGKTNFKLKQFENTPLLHQLICEQSSLENQGSSNEIEKEQARKKLRAEFSLIRNLQLQKQTS